MYKTSLRIGGPFLVAAALFLGGYGAGRLAQPRRPELLLGRTEVEVIERLGPPSAELGDVWEYDNLGPDVIYLHFKNGKVVKAAARMTGD